MAGTATDMVFFFFSPESSLDGGSSMTQSRVRGAVSPCESQTAVAKFLIIGVRHLDRIAASG